MGFVLDASVSACWAFDDEQHTIADAALDLSGIEEIFVPSLWWFEIRNLLIVAERRKRLAVATTNVFLRSMQRLNLSIDRAPEEAEVLRLARRHGLTVYDSGYLELAMRERLPLATLDRKLAAAAENEGVNLIG
ncbi:MAG TPA: type II toxin-antitoxin system VapC family toxin [Rhodopila sp.]|jgi:predicted nucleic acid-binding protein|nr:type II toxin-antitoxin system VapC family toxin [Rhodopila sp.]